MAEYSNAAIQTVAAGASVLFTESLCGCSCGIMHRAGSGLFTISRPGKYRVTFGANLSVPTGGDAGPVSVAIAIDGEALNSATATVTPAAADQYFNVAAVATVYVPCSCCAAISVRNPGTVPVSVSNPNLIIEPA